MSYVKERNYCQHQQMPGKIFAKVIKTNSTATDPKAWMRAKSIGWQRAIHGDDDEEHVQASGRYHDDPATLDNDNWGRPVVAAAIVGWRLPKAPWGGRRSILSSLPAKKTIGGGMAPSSDIHR